MAKQAKKHTLVKEDKWKFNRTKKSPDYEKNCTDGFRRAALCEVHHCMCEHALSDAHMGDDKDKIYFIHLCLMITPWDLDWPENTIGLPKKWAYVNETDSKATVKARTRSFSAKELAFKNKSDRDAWDGFPCHQVDHNPYYTSWTCERVQDEIWDPVAKVKSDEECTKVDPENLLQKFKTEAKFFKDFLTGRGKENGGTRHCLAWAIANLSAKTKPQKDWVAGEAWIQAELSKVSTCSASNWWVCFSMDGKKPPTERQPPTIRAKQGVLRDSLLDMVS